MHAGLHVNTIVLFHKSSGVVEANAWLRVYHFEVSNIICRRLIAVAKGCIIQFCS